MISSKALLSTIMSILALIPSLSFVTIATTRRITNTARQLPPPRRRYPILHCMETQYTINDEVCPPLDEIELKDTVQKRCETLETFLANKPIARHTQAAFDQIISYIKPDSNIILDSGCGTARSTLILGDLYPDHTIIGVDRSLVRLNKNILSRKKTSDGHNQKSPREEEEDDDSSFHVVSSNVILVRADLTDFWRCCLDAEWRISKHFILYPNPCPKKKVFKNRWYAHPSFPLILKLGGEEILIRSNWEGYLKEFAKSIDYAHQFYSSRDREDFALPYLQDAHNGPVERLDKTIALTNFEKKYDDCGERTHELKLKRTIKSNGVDA
mmetsp:Transcript_3932/g.5676  ORF Transcript_3932/g.5676 Transcript_3932/m.5676 type:complete len:327 (-) Transcript_3932:65-1045(-)